MRFRIFFAALLLAAIAGTVPAAMAQDACGNGGGTYVAGTLTVQTMIAGSSAMWQSMALGAYNNHVSIYGNGPTHHYVSSAKFNLVDTRPTAISGGAAVTGSDTTWIVWDGVVVAGKCNSNVWAYEKADSVIGNRALFGSIGLSQTKGVFIEAPASFPANNASGIASTLWGDGSTGENVPAGIQALFASSNEAKGSTAPNLVNVGATDIDPADAFFATARINAVGDTTNGYQGLGYGVNAVNTPPNFGADLAHLVGTAIKGDYSADPAAGFPVLAFNLSGQDPFTGKNLPSFTTIPVGASPIVVIHSNNGGQLGSGGAAPFTSKLSNASEAEIGRVFAGLGNAAGSFGGCSTCAGYAAYLREPLSGTYNTFEETLARHPSKLAVFRYSQETGNVSGTTVAHNPLAAFDGYRYRAIGTGNEVASVLNSNTNHAKDGIGYTFFSFGNVSGIANNSAYSYITVNDTDPIWHNYVPGSVGITDPAQNPTAGQLPNSTTNLPAGCTSPGGVANPHLFPCNENLMWQADNYAQVNGSTVASYSFPNVRNGSYPSWSLLRLVAAGASGPANDLVNASNIYVVNTVPDYVPFNFVIGSDNVTIVDPGLQVLRSHFGCDAQTCGTNPFTGLPNDPSQGAVELGRDAGGAILSFLDATTQLTQDGLGVVSFQ